MSIQEIHQLEKDLKGAKEIAHCEHDYPQAFGYLRAAVEHFLARTKANHRLESDLERAIEKTS